VIGSGTYTQPFEVPQKSAGSVVAVVPTCVFGFELEFV
jgi:hypothetical protein